MGIEQTSFALQSFFNYCGTGTNARRRKVATLAFMGENLGEISHVRREQGDMRRM
jgi:hypothetical protein